MAGHSKWANIKYRKERADAAKGKVFSRIAKEIISAVKQGGDDPKSNHRLKAVIDKAKAANVPNENIERNIKKGSSLDQSDYTLVNYELYGHGGVGIVVEAMTDNKNRTASEMRIATNKRGGSLAGVGAVLFNFDLKGVLRIEKREWTLTELFVIATDADAEDIEEYDSFFLVTTAPDCLYAIKEVFENRGVEVSVDLEQIPKHLIACSKEDMILNEQLIAWLEGLDDVDVVYHNMKMEEGG